MKKLLLLTIGMTTLSASQLYAQPKKGDKVLGVDMLPIVFKGGYFFSDRFMAGVSLNPGGTFSFRAKDIDVNIFPGVFARYYFAGKEGMKINSFYFFLDAKAAFRYSYSRDINTKRSFTNTDIRAGFAPGITYIASRNISLNGSLAATLYNDFNNSYSHINIAPEVGVQLNIRGKRKTPVLE